MAPRAVKVVFLNISPRLHTLRTLIISSLLLISVNVEWTLVWRVNPVKQGFWIALYAFIAVHQILSTFKWSIFYGVIELPILIVEVIGTGHYAKNVPLQTWVPETFVFHAVLAWLVVGTLSLTICFRIVDVIYSKGQSLTRPFDILAVEENSPQSKSVTKGWVTTFHMLFGRSIWGKNFVGETVCIRAIRGILAVIVLSAVFFCTLLDVVFSPIKEIALSPVKAYRISGITPTDLVGEIEPPVWRVTYLAPFQFTNSTEITYLISPEDYFSAVSVTGTWPNIPASETTTHNPLECHQETSFGSGNDRYFFYRCPTSVFDNQWVLPDLNINVNFGRLASISRLYLRPQLPLVIGLSNNTFDDYTHTVPVTIIPGVNMAAPYILGIRQIYTNNVLATLGIFEATKTFLLPNIIAFYPDPTATFTGRNRSSLNIFSQTNYGEVPFIQDYQDKSVLAGFSSVGGLWTAFSGIFTILYGASMLHIFYGLKPLSIFGMAHKFQADAMKKDCLARYPQILKENRSPEHRGLLSLIRDHLINLDFVDDEKDDPSSSEDQDTETDVEISLVAGEHGPGRI